MDNLNLIVRMLYKQRLGFLDEHIYLPGAPHIVVTRRYAYHWLLAAGCDPRERGFKSVDYLAFFPSPLDEPLTDLAAPETAAFLANEWPQIIRAIMTDDRDTR